jgi:hypothetical protein
MLEAELFEKLDAIGRHVRATPDKPFGGIQFILYVQAIPTFALSLHEVPPAYSTSSLPPLNRFYRFLSSSPSTGDFFQLPPIKARQGDGENPRRFIFESDLWSEMLPPDLGTSHHLSEVFRQTDPALIQHLHDLRVKQMTDDARKLFRGTAHRVWTPEELPKVVYLCVVHLSCVNRAVVYPLSSMSLRL